MIDIDVAVIGAGIAGLTTAYRLGDAGRAVRVFELEDRVGGRMASRRYEGFVIDEGAETIAARGYEATWSLIRSTGVDVRDVLPVEASFALWRHGRAHGRLGHPLGLLTGAGMSWRGRLSWLRMSAELAADSRDFDPDHPELTPAEFDTLAEYAVRYHRDVLDLLLQPLSGHCFGWRPDSSAAGPMISNLMAVGGAGARWMTYRDGMDRLARELAARVDVTTGVKIVQVKPGSGAVRLDLASGATITARRVVMAIPAPLALDTHADPPDDELAFLEASTYAPMLKVACLLDRPLDCGTRARSYVMSVPAVESRTIAGFVFDHVKAPNRVPVGCGLVNVFASPWCAPDLLEAPDDEVVSALCDEAERYVPGLREATRATFVCRFRHGLPRATPAALRERNDFLRRPTRRVEYAGDWVMLRPSSEGAVRSGELAARRVLAAEGR
jgi:oxygen-dependent protoporphyrinogen oxidase